MTDDGPRFVKLSPGVYRRQYFRRRELTRIAQHVPTHFQEGHARSYGLALSLLRLYFGMHWLERHVLGEPKNGYLARHLGSHEGTNETMHRVRELAELILNLQHVSGIEGPMEKVAGGEIEAALTEMRVGRLLMNHGRPFRFITPNGVKGESYDIEVRFPSGVLGCADAKCKIETGDFSEKGLRHVLDSGRAQLPADRPGVLFVSIPQRWRDSNDLMGTIEQACRTFLRGTKRIVCIEVFSAFTEMKGDVYRDWLAGTEYRSDFHRFDRTVDWRLLTTWLDYVQGPRGDLLSWRRIDNIYNQTS